MRPPRPWPPPPPDDAPAKKKYPKPPLTPPCHRGCDCEDCLARERERAAWALERALARDRLHLLVEWVELKREVALVCRLCRAWFGRLGAPWHTEKR